MEMGIELILKETRNAARKKSGQRKKDSPARNIPGNSINGLSSLERGVYHIALMVKSRLVKGSVSFP